jgi:hypothetical protein
MPAGLYDLDDVQLECCQQLLDVHILDAGVVHFSGETVNIPRYNNL